eukprot:6203258-Pleurochrysis_carterae.AAC.1
MNLYPFFCVWVSSQVSSARLSFCPFAPSSPSPASMYVKRDGTRLQRNGAPFVFFGADVWYAAHLGAADASLGGNRLRLSREFDRLRALGARLVRIQAASEGVGTEGVHSVGGSDGARPPALQPQPGVMDEKVALGLDFALHAAAARNLTVLLCLNNFWPWSGGFVQYLRWAGERTTPPPSGKERDAFAQHAALFYTECARAHGRLGARLYLPMLLSLSLSLSPILFLARALSLTFSLCLFLSL